MIHSGISDCDQDLIIQGHQSDFLWALQYITVNHDSINIADKLMYYLTVSLVFGEPLDERL